MTPCQQFIIDQLKRSPCRVEAFDGREFDKQTVDKDLIALMHQDKVVYDFETGAYKFNPTPNPHVYKTPNLKPRKPDVFEKARTERKARTQRYSGPLEDNTSTERGGGRHGHRNNS